MKHIKSIFLLTVLMSMVGAKAFAYDIAVKNDDGVTIYYSFLRESELAVDCCPDDEYYTGIVKIPEKVNYEGKSYTVTSIGSSAFQFCSGLTSVTIPNSVTTIGNSAFNYCSNMTSVTIGNNVTSIGDYAFYDCRGLKSFVIPNTVTSIGNFAFSSCKGLTSVTIGKSVTSIGIHAFNCDNLVTIVSLIEKPFEIYGISAKYDRVFSESAFMNATLYVPAGTKETYKKTEGWKDFRYIEEGTDGVASVRAHAVLVKSNEGLLTIEGVDDGTLVSVYGISGLQVGSVISQNGRAVINTKLKAGSIAIVKIGEKSVKVVVK